MPIFLLQPDQFIHYPFRASEADSAALEHGIKAVAAGVGTPALGFHSHERDIPVLIQITMGIEFPPVRHRQGIKLLAMDYAAPPGHAAFAGPPKNARDRGGGGEIFQKLGKDDLGLAGHSQINFRHFGHQALGKEGKPGASQHQGGGRHVLLQEGSQGLQVRHKRQQISRKGVEVAKGYAHHLGSEVVQGVNQLRPGERTEIEIQPLDFVPSANDCCQAG